MNLSESLDTLIERDPNRSYFAHKQAAYFYKDRKRDVQYTLSILPGANGETCDQFQFQTLEEALAKAIESLNPPTQNNE